MVTLAEMTGRETLQARPSAALEGTKTYGTFCRDARGYFSKMDTTEKQSGTHLLFAKQREMEQNLKWLSVSGQHDELGDTTVESLGS